MLASNALSIASTSWALLMPDNWEFRDGFPTPEVKAKETY